MESNNVFWLYYPTNFGSLATHVYGDETGNIFANIAWKIDKKKHITRQLASALRYHNILFIGWRFRAIH